MLTFLKRTLAVAAMAALSLSAAAQKVFLQNVYPTYDTTGGTVTLYGRGFTNMTSLYFGSLQAAFTVLSDTVATATVPASGNYIEAVAGDGSNSYVIFEVVYSPAQGNLYISGISLKYGHTGDVISVRGRGFTGVSSVQIGGNPVTSFTIVSDTLITAVVSGQSNGSLEVLRDNSNYAWSNGDTFINLDTYTYPYVTSFSPAFATTGTTLTINGINFTGATNVELSNGPASSFTVVSPTQLTAVVGSQSNSTQSRITIWTPAMYDDSIAGPTMYPLAAPVVTGFTPASDSAGQVVTITGSNFTGADSVFFGGGPVSNFTVVSPGTILAYVGNDATSGAVKVHNAAGYGSLSGFTYNTSQPTVTSIVSDRQAGDQTIINGTNLTGATAVYFGTIPATAFRVYSATEIAAAIPPGAEDVPITVVTPNGSATSTQNFNLAPTLTGISPEKDSTGAVVTIRGSAFYGVKQVYFGTAPAATFTVVSDTLILATVGSGASGYVSAYAKYADSTSVQDTAYAQSFFFFPDSGPAIRNFTSPGSDTVGQTVTIDGAHFTGTTSVTFGGRPAASFTVLSDSVITAIVGVDTSGLVAVTTPQGMASMAGFHYVGYEPHIHSFYPNGDTAGQVVTLLGSHLANTTIVYFGDVNTFNYTIVSDSMVQVTVPSGARSGTIGLYVNGALYTSIPGFVYGVVPIIQSYTPVSDTAHGAVTLRGYHFTGTTAVSFGGTPAGSFSVTSDTTISATVGNGASGQVYVVTSKGTDSLAGFTFITQPGPVITSFAPTSDTTGGTVAITGTALTGVDHVYFGALPAASFTVVSDTLIRAVVGSGSSGPISVFSLHGGDTSTATFTLLPTGPAPKIDTLYNMYGSAGQFIQIYGQNIGNATAVTFGGTPAATFQVINSGIVVAKLGSGSSGWVTVTTPYGRDSFPNFWYVTGPPTLIGFYPQSANTGDTLRIVGNNLVGPTQVLLGGKPAKIIYSDPGQVNVIVGDGATGNLEFVNGYGTATTSGFTYTGTVPSLITLTPTSDSAGKTVTLRGQRLSGATALDFGSVPASSYTVVSDSVITAVVPTGVTSHFIGVTTPGGVDSLGGFTYLGAPPPVPVITSFTPVSDTLSGTVTVSGKYFTGATAVYFGATASPFFKVVSDTVITAAVFGGTGPVEVVTPNGPGYSRDTFTFIAWPKPVISSFSPGADTVGGAVNIIGSGFTRIGQVYFGGEQASSFTIVSDSLIRAVVGSGASGPIVVWSAKQGADTSSGSFTLLPFTKPAITNFTPSTDTSGGVVTLSGWGLSSANTVTFGGVPAASFTILSDSTIEAVVGNGATGDIIVFTAHGSDTVRGFTFVQPTQHSISSLRPTSDTAGVTITIDGVGFYGVTGVLFGSQPASFSVTSTTAISAVVPAGTGGGDQVVSVILPGDTLRYDYFTVLDTLLPPPAKPQIFSFSPTSDTTGGTVTIHGAHLTGADVVSFGGTYATSVSVISDSVVTAVVGKGSSGAVKIATPGGVAMSDSLTSFTWLGQPLDRLPTITSFSPIMDSVGGTVTITGANLGDVNWVHFGGTAATSFTVVSPTTITATLGYGSTGIVELGTNEGIAASVDTFLYIGASPGYVFAVLSFKGAMVSNQAQLTWITQYDRGIATYNLESSSDSVNFTQIYSVQSRRVDGVGNAYSFVDPNPVQGNNFYRLTAVDTLGNTAGTWQTTLDVPIRPQVTTLPNPATGAIYIQVPYSVHNATLTLVDLNGKPVRTMNVPSGAYQVRMDLTGVPGGIYVLTWQDGTNRTEKHIMVQ